MEFQTRDGQRWRVTLEPWKWSGGSWAWSVERSVANGWEELGYFEC